MPTPAPANKELPLLEPETGIYETYANNVDADWTGTDVTIRFMQLVFSAENDRATVNNREMVLVEKADITIPWWTVKVLAEVLNRLVDAHEAANGELKQPILAQLDHQEKPNALPPKRSS